MESLVVLEPFFFTYAMHVQEYDMLLVADGGAYPAIELVDEQEEDPQDEDYVIIKLVSQRTLRVMSHLQVSVARKGVNTNQI